MAGASKPCDVRRVVSRYKYVSWHKSRKQWAAQGCWSGKRRFEFFDTEDAAATAVSKWSRKTIEDLRKDAGAMREKLSEAQGKLKILVHIYDDLEEKQGDIETLERHARTASRKVFQQDPLMEYLSVVSKYGPCKDAMLEAYHKVGMQHAQVGAKWAAGSDQRAEKCDKMLLCSLKLSQGQNYESWVENCGRNVSHHSGRDMMMLRFGYFKPASPTCKSPRAMWLCSQDHPYLLQNSAAARKCRLKHLKNLDEAVAVLYALPSWQKAPRSTEDWIQQFRDGLKALIGRHVVGLHVTKALLRSQKGYLVWWTLRGLLLSRMRRAGILRLAVDRKTTVNRWSKWSGPDSKNMYTRLQPTAAPERNLQKFFKMVGYAGPAELFGVIACFSSDPAIMKVSLSWMRKRKSVLRSLRVAYKKKHGLNRVPGGLIADALALEHS